jgi:hypothetical protein
MFANEIRMAGLKALAKYHFKEGIPVGMKFAQTQSRHGSESRTGEIMDLLLTYGSAAKGIIPDLEKLIASFEAEVDFPEDCRNQKIQSVKLAIQKINAASSQPDLRTMQATTSH